MSSVLSALDVELPKRSSGFGGGSQSKKPRAIVRVRFGQDDCYELVVPVRFARTLCFQDYEGLEPREFFERFYHAQAASCFSLLVEMLSRRDHSKAEAAKKLALYGYREEEIAPAIERACLLGYLDDARFASAFVRERISRGWGPRKIELELTSRGIDAREIPGYPDDYYDDEDLPDRAYRLLCKKNVPESRPREKLIRFLMGKGFSYDVSACAADRRLGQG
ncbi:MAG: regulatory protein RecX [Coriobacteriaceae bacterium]|nr:regulatory protein RecX [Coriobacteriaceae bacterium]